MKFNNAYMELVADVHKVAYLQFRKGDHKREPWGSHQPVLIHMLNTITTGDVLEFGMGFNSTPIIHIICEQQGRKVVSIDQYQEWVDKFAAYKNSNHEMIVYNRDELMAKQYPFFERTFSLAFIDGSPTEMRQLMIYLLRHNVDYFIVHDTEEMVYSIRPTYYYNFSIFRHILHFKRNRPTTTVLSNLRSINERVYDVFG